MRARGVAGRISRTREGQQHLCTLNGGSRLQRDDPAALLQRLLGRLEQPDDAQAGGAVVDRRLVVQDAVDEVVELDLQRFGLLAPSAPRRRRSDS